MVFAKFSSALRFGLLLGAMFAFAPLAQALDKPEGKVVLVVQGKITNRNTGDTASFDMKMLEAMPQKTFTTQTPWYPAPVTFKGPLLRDVLAAVGATNAKALEAKALNDYKVAIPAEDATKMDVVLAISLDGKPMSVREKGPIFVIYPLDTVPANEQRPFAQRSIWQLASIKVD